MKSSRNQISPYDTKDGSLIRELIHPQRDPGARHQSLAEAEVSPGATTRLHRHLKTEEIYHILSGEGLMTLAESRFSVAPGDSILIPPGTWHCITNTGTAPLRLLCCCSPPYSHEDTVLSP